MPVSQARDKVARKSNTWLGLDQRPDGRAVALALFWSPHRGVQWPLQTASRGGVVA